MRGNTCRRDGNKIRGKEKGGKNEEERDKGRRMGDEGRNFFFLLKLENSSSSHFIAHHSFLILKYSLFLLDLFRHADDRHHLKDVVDTDDAGAAQNADRHTGGRSCRSFALFVSLTCADVLIKCPFNEGFA